MRPTVNFGSKKRSVAFRLMVGLISFLVTFPATAHRSGCHRWHSCPADHGTYECGDTGHCSECENNQFCQGGQRRPVDSSNSRTYPTPPNKLKPALDEK